MIDPNLLAAPDFIAVRAALVALMGNDGNRALVLTRIHWRTTEANRDTHERDGQLWWRVRYQTLSDETGLTVGQLKRIVPWLVASGFIETREFRLDGITDRTLSMRVLTDGADSHSRGAIRDLDGADSHSQGSADSHSLPSIKKEETLLFDQFWLVYPRKVAKGTAAKAWKTAIKKLEPAKIVFAAAAFTARMKGSDPQFIPHPSTWLNGERWADEPDRAEPLERRPLSPSWMDPANTDTPYARSLREGLK